LHRGAYLKPRIRRVGLSLRVKRGLNQLRLLICSHVRYGERVMA
jgi:hypothetical protein